MATIVSYQDTPNPHALKCVLDAPLAALTPAGSAAIRSYQSTDAAAHDPHAAALLRVPGVKGVLIGAGGSWLTVNKDSAATWKSIKPALEACVRSLR